MKPVAFTEENYDFQKAVRQFIRQEIRPLLRDEGFAEYRPFQFARERSGLAQFITFSIQKRQLKAFAYFLPVWSFCDTVMEYGIEITGSSGIGLLSGKYFTVVFEDEFLDRAVQFRHFQQEHLPHLGQIVLSLREGVLPEMNAVASLNALIAILESDSPVFFGRHDRQARTSVYGRFVEGVYTAAYRDFAQGREQLAAFRESLRVPGEPDGEMEEWIDMLLAPSPTASPQEAFRANLERVSEDFRQKHALNGR